jgi:TIR domain
LATPEVFISHTDSQDADARAFRTKLAKGLKTKGYEPVLDEQRLELGDAWRRQLMIWMLGCHAGLILVSKKTLKGTPWMHFEAAVLVMRRTNSQIANAGGQPTFPVIPVLLPPVGPADFSSSWLEPHALDEIQGGRADDELVEKIVRRLDKAGLKERLADSPLRRLQSVITPWLRKVGLDVLQETGNDLGAITTTWAIDDAPDRLAIELLKADLDGVQKAMQRLAPQLPERADKLVDILAAGWVDPEAAAKLPPIAISDRRVAAINAQYPDFSGPTYLRRAWVQHPLPPIVYVTEPGEGDAEGAMREVLSAVRNSNPGMNLPTEQDANAFMAVAAGGAAFHVALTWIPEATVLETLVARLPSATFLCLSVDGEAESKDARPVSYLLPEIDRSIETKAYHRYHATKSSTKGA